MCRKESDFWKPNKILKFLFKNCILRYKTNKSSFFSFFYDFIKKYKIQDFLMFKIIYIIYKSRS